ncbi:MAG: ATP-dependent helicase/nuclease subunit A, partial [Myxococcota bacterium]
GDTSLVGAVDALRNGIKWGDAETPLEPGSGDAVRLMNIHKAKGLEAKVVILASPRRRQKSTPRLHIARDEGGNAVGYLQISIGRGSGRVIGRPYGWREYEAHEQVFLDAEGMRLRYVAATRAADELIIGTREKESASPWKVFEPWLEEYGTALEAFDIVAAAPPGAPDATPAVISERIREADVARATLAAPSYRVDTVTSLAKDQWTDPLTKASQAPAVDPPDARQPRGFEWGSVVHAALAALGRGVEGSAWDGLARSLLVDYGRPLSSDGEPSELGALKALVATVSASDVWKRASAAEAMLVEAPFAAVVAREPDRLVEGVVDLAFKDGPGWVLVDYKTDVGDDDGFAGRVGAYRTQVDLYAQAWAALTGEPVVEKVLFFTTQDRQERW